MPHPFILLQVDVVWTRAGRLSEKSCLWDNNKLQAATRICWGLSVISWMRSSTVSITDFGSKSRDHSIPSVATEKIMPLYSRLIVFEMRLEMNLWLTVSTNGMLTQLGHKWNDSRFFSAQVRVWLIVIGVGMFSKKELIFLFRSHDSSFCEKKLCHYHQTTKLSVLGP